jgi:hypothetical protein
MFRIGILFTSIGIILYIVHAIIYNRFLRKNHPEIFDDSLRPRHSRKRSKKVSVVVVSGQTPAWVMLLGIPAIPLFLLGIVITIVALIINFFQ